MRTYLSEKAQENISDTLQRKVLTTVMYHFRHLCKGIMTQGYWFIKPEEFSEFLDVSDDELFDAMDELCQNGYLVVEQHGEWLWFRANTGVLDNSMSKLMTDEVCNVMIKYLREKKEKEQATACTPATEEDEEPLPF